jgi:hypothetical protein
MLPQPTLRRDAQPESRCRTNHVSEPCSASPPTPSALRPVPRATAEDDPICDAQHQLNERLKSFVLRSNGASTSFVSCDEVVRLTTSLSRGEVWQLNPSRRRKFCTAGQLPACAGLVRPRLPLYRR